MLASIWRFEVDPLPFIAGPVVAPIEKGEKIANLVVSNKNNVIKTLPLYAAEDLKKVNFFKSLITSINYLIWGDV